jgi:hypothetical protein
MTNADVALLISGLALLISILSLYINSLSPFRLRISHDAPTFTIYTITPQISGNTENQTWWIPSFDLGISFYNSGRVSGEVLDIRIVGEFKSHRSSSKYTFFPKWVVNYPDFKGCRGDRMKWIDKSVIKEWYPLLIKGQSDVVLHLILESDRWDQKQYGEMTFDIEVISSKNRKWENHGSYSMQIIEYMYAIPQSHTVYDKRIEELRKL